MSVPLWTIAEAVAASGATVDAAATAGEIHGTIDGISIDTRTLERGDLFVALADVRDGHDFVTNAFAAGASAALVAQGYVRKPGDGLLLRVDSPQIGLERLGVAARARLSPEARVVAVTGSVGKTTTKEMLRACLAPQGKTHAAVKSFNNHWGVPLTLARMSADTRYGVFEIGMNHAGEITPLSGFVRPHVAIVTAVEAVHLEAFASVSAIAEAKAEIFSGLVPGGTAIVPRDNEHYGVLAARAIEHGMRLSTFGTNSESMLRLVSIEQEATRSRIVAAREGGTLEFSIGLPGNHMASNALAVAATLDALGLHIETAIAPLAAMGAPQGRGSRKTVKIGAGEGLVIDESYNANPASMRAALAAMATLPRTSFPRRIAVLGDMLELGGLSNELHAGLASAIAENGIDGVFACGAGMRHLYDVIPAEKRFMWAPSSEGLRDELLARVAAGDVVMVKGSNGSRMAPLVAALLDRHIPAHSNE